MRRISLSKVIAATAVLAATTLAPPATLYAVTDCGGLAPSQCRAISAAWRSWEGKQDKYPVRACVSTKQKEAGKYCKALLTAWARWDGRQDSVARDAAIAKAAARLDGKWDRANLRSLNAGSDCADTTLASAAARAQIDGAATNIVTQINGGLDLGSRVHRACGADLLNAVARTCGQLLHIDSAYIKALSKDRYGVARDARKAEASATLATLWPTVEACPTTATEADIEARLDTIDAAIVLDTTVSPNVDNTQFTTITPTGPIAYQRKSLNPVCMDGSPYSYFVKRGSVNKLLIYYQGGGACWENISCSVPACDTNVNPTGGDNPNSWTTGFANASNALNPFKDWNIVFVAYCSCDIHFGDAAQDYFGPLPAIHVEHRGYENARVVEKWAREHFLNPERVFVTGSSAGAYGAWFNAPLHQAVWPASHFDVLADAGNGVITQDFLDTQFPNWSFEANIPAAIPGLQASLTAGLGITGYTEIVASFFPDTRWAHYSTAFDGGDGSQTSFYQVMLNPGNPYVWQNWWEASCAFHTNMRQQAIDTAAAVPSNYRYYIGSGSRHTMWGSNKVYTSTTGGVPTLVDWLNAMLANSTSWVNVEASPYNLLLSGDARPSPLQAPFASSGANVVVNCP